ncbi:UNVERIFIED_CONTAM: hypothetical protein Sindi_0097900 [Sesamum indicum]
MIYAGSSSVDGRIRPFEDGDNVSVMEDGRMRSVQLATMEPSDLGFFGAEKMHGEKSMETADFSITGEYSNVVGDGGDVPMRKDPILQSFQGCSKVGFGNGALKRAVNGGGDSSSPPVYFNIEEFLLLANMILDGDDKSKAALNDLKARWEKKFGRFAANKLVTSPVPSRKPMRCVWPAKKNCLVGKITATTTTTGDEGGAPADEEEKDGDGGRPETEDRRLVSGEQYVFMAEIEKTRLLGGRSKAVSDETDSSTCCHGFSEGNGRFLAEKGDLSSTNLIDSDLGFCAVADSEQTREEDEPTPIVLAMTDEQLMISEGGDTIPVHEASNLAGNEGDKVRRPILGFNGANLNGDNGGQQEGVINMLEFLRLANTVIDAGDRESRTALEELKSKWKRRFGKEAVARCFPATAPHKAPPIVKPSHGER